MIAASAGWHLLGVERCPIRRIRACVIRAVAEGGRPIRVAPFALTRRASVSALSVLVDRSDRSGRVPPPWDALADVPAGTYAIRYRRQRRRRRARWRFVRAVRLSHSTRPDSAVAEQVLTVADSGWCVAAGDRARSGACGVMQTIDISPVDAGRRSAPVCAERSAPSAPHRCFSLTATSIRKMPRSGSGEARPLAWRSWRPGARRCRRPCQWRRDEHGHVRCGQSAPRRAARGRRIEGRRRSGAGRTVWPSCASGRPRAFVRQIWARARTIAIWACASR